MSCQSMGETCSSLPKIMHGGQLPAVNIASHNEMGISNATRSILFVEELSATKQPQGQKQKNGSPVSSFCIDTSRHHSSTEVTRRHTFVSLKAWCMRQFDQMERKLSRDDGDDDDDITMCKACSACSMMLSMLDFVIENDDLVFEKTLDEKEAVISDLCKLLDQLLEVIALGKSDALFNSMVQPPSSFAMIKLFRHYLHPEQTKSGQRRPSRFLTLVYRRVQDVAYPSLDDRRVIGKLLVDEITQLAAEIDDQTVPKNESRGRRRWYWKTEPSKSEQSRLPLFLSEVPIVQCAGSICKFWDDIPESDYLVILGALLHERNSHASFHAAARLLLEEKVLEGNIASWMSSEWILNLLRPGVSDVYVAGLLVNALGMISSHPMTMSTIIKSTRHVLGDHRYAESEDNDVDGDVGGEKEKGRKDLEGKIQLDSSSAPALLIEAIHSLKRMTVNASSVFQKRLAIRDHRVEKEDEKVMSSLTKMASDLFQMALIPPASHHLLDFGISFFSCWSLFAQLLEMVPHVNVKWDISVRRLLSTVSPRVYLFMTACHKRLEVVSLSRKSGKGKKTKELELMPNLVFQMEKLDGVMIDLCKRRKLDWMRYMKRSTVRDFRINNRALLENVKRTMTGDEEEEEEDEEEEGNGQEESEQSGREEKEK
eukprot:TRINITY_DN149_c1_g6_i1.p1 TRINITY_DN149_c1_g6~~TRINITY_DN149_c1_g6_i1.p1  ORF type:complete len:654 (-),score=202.29 TRINITY_DN149_c1_g6_i1:151-2112(-)